MDAYKNMSKLGIVLPKAPARGGSYSPVKEFGKDLAYVSGCGPQIEGRELNLGKIGRELTEEQGNDAAVNCIMNLLAVLEKELGDLNKIKSFVKIIVFVASDDDFYNQPQVANYASQILADIFGEENGTPARSAVGMNVLPGNIPVEIEALVELK